MANSDDNGSLSALDLARAALVAVEELTGYPPEAATGLEWDGEAWCVTVEALELGRVPNTTDVLGEYHAVDARVLSALGEIHESGGITAPVGAAEGK